MLDHLGHERLREFAFTAADLLVSADAYGRIVQADGDATLLHHPSCDRLIGKNVLDLISEGEARRLREELWALGPGRRLSWEDAGSIEEGRRIVVQRNLLSPERFNITLSRMSPSTRLRVDRASDILADRFRDAVMNGRLKVARQPVVDARTGALSHYEMLARFNGEDSPTTLICAAEKSGQISHLDYIMVHAAAARLACEPDPAFRLAVNISGESIQRPDVVHELRAVISGHEFVRSRLIVEVTESSEISDLDAAARSVSSLRASGVSVSLDDFGSGAASFSYLRALEVDSLKFDGAFLRNAGPGERGVALMRNIARMCAELGISSIGERVETEADRQLLLAAGVGFGQGYLFGRPVIDETFFARRALALRAAA
jgi:EAL domain-containing protein (putative c-di-GMP-specific phosphodiesterase class I)